MKKAFGAVQWMRDRRAEIDREDESLTWEEKREKTRRLLENDPLWQRLRPNVVEPRNAPAAVRENQAPYRGRSARPAEKKTE